MEDNLLLLMTKMPKVEAGQRVILGIDGLSRSGKTTFIDKLSQILHEETIPVCIFHIDDYIVEREKRYNTKHEEWYEYYNLQWDIEWLADNLFNKLNISNEVNLPMYDNLSDTHKMQVVTIPTTCLIIIEGVFLQRKEWQCFYDYIVYIDCPRDKRFNRESAITQRNIEKFRNRYWKAEDYYIQIEAPEDQADLVLKG